MVICKKSEENQTLAWIYKTRQKPNKKMRETETLGFLETTVNRVGEKQKTKQNQGRKQSVQKTKYFVCINARKKKSL
jgi:hypothetical protein